MLKYSGSRKQHARPVLAAVSIIIILAVLGAGVQGVLASTSLVPEVVYTGTIFTRNAVTADSSNTPYIYANGILFKRAASGWVQQYNVLPAGTHSPTLFVDQSNTIHTFYHITGTPNNTTRLFHAECNTALPQGTTCPPAEELATRPAENPSAPQFGYTDHSSAVEDANGNLHVVYGYYYGYWGLFYVERTGGIWSTPVRVHPGTPNEGYMLIDDVSLRLDPDGTTLHAAFNNRESFQVPYGVYYGKKSATGSWVVEPVIQDPAALQQLAMAMDGSTPLIVYPYRRPDFLYDLRLATRLPNGSWTHETLYQGATGGIQSIEAEFLNGTLHVVFTHGSGSSDDFRPVYVTKELPGGIPTSQRIFDFGFNGSTLVSMAAAPSAIHISFSKGNTLKYLGLSQVNQAPVAADDTYNVNQDTTLNVSGRVTVQQVSAIAEVNNGDAPKIIDGNTSTIWLAAGESPSITLDLGQVRRIAGFRETSGVYSGNPFVAYASNDGVTYYVVASGYFSRSSFGEHLFAPRDARYIKFTVYRTDNLGYGRLAEVEILEDKGVLTNDSDIDADTLTAMLVNDVNHGTLTLSGDGAFTYTPNSGYIGPDWFTYKNNDGAADSNVATVNLSVTPVNNPPVANGDTANTAEDTSVTVNAAANDTDPDGNLAPATTMALSGPAHGSLINHANGSFTYTPATNYHGTDSFTYRVCDTGDLCDAATVLITVSPVNDAPLADPKTVTTAEDTAVGVTLTGSDVEEDALTFSVVAQPTRGSLSGTAPHLTYTPNPNYNGSDSFTYRASDGVLNSNTATVSITLNPVNDAPVANPQSLDTDEDTPLNITLTGSDVETTLLTYTVTVDPVHGSLSGTAPALTYTPDSNYNGADSFKFTAGDGVLTSAEATVSIMVSAVNDMPVAVGGNFTTDEDTTLTVTAPGVLSNDTDLEYSALTAVLVSGPAHGTLALDASGSFSYVPATNWNGADSFTYKASDGDLDSNIAAASIAVTAVNDVPLADAQAVTTDEDTAKAVTLTGSDVESTISFEILTGPSHGTLNGTAPQVTYLPDPDYNGLDSFTFKVKDGIAESDTATVSISVTAVNDAPVASNDSYNAQEDAALTVAAPGALANDSDVDSSSLTAALVSGPANGSLALSADGSFVYIPAANFNGADSFTYAASDGTFNSNEATVTIAVTPVNEGPVADDHLVTTDEDTSVDITLTASDADGDALTFDVVTPPAHGSLSGTAPNLTYMPALNFHGVDHFTFRACDVGGLCSLAAITVEVIQVNQPPTVDAGGPYSVDEGSSVEVTATGLDPENGPLIYAWDLDNDGTFETSGQTVPFAASGLDGPGTATIQVQVTDDGGLTDTAQTTVNVLNTAPALGEVIAPIDPVRVNTVINASVDFTDLGLLDTHTAVWDWGDGSASAGAVTETNGSCSVTGEHTYMSAGVFTIQVTVTDKDGDSGESTFQFVVIYDPDGGFVTGGGWITSPPGAYVADPSLAGKATFGFVSKYQKGANIPTGNTEFQFHVANMNFKSTTYDWLVIAGTKAQFRGTGTINGTGNYGFLLTGIDGSPDKFRIKIWDKVTGDTVYDNMLGAADDVYPTTAIEGGSIVIHKPK